MSEQEALSQEQVLELIGQLTNIGGGMEIHSPFISGDEWGDMFATDMQNTAIAVIFPTSIHQENGLATRSGVLTIYHESGPFGAQATWTAGDNSGWGAHDDIDTVIEQIKNFIASRLTVEQQQKILSELEGLKVEVFPDEVAAELSCGILGAFSAYNKSNDAGYINIFDFPDAEGHEALFGIDFVNDSTESPWSFCGSRSEVMQALQAYLADGTIPEQAD